MDRDVSPPPSKRRKLSTPTLDTDLTTSVNHLPSRDTTDTLRIFAWNINGISPFIQSAKPITSFFPRTHPTTQPTKNNSSPPSIPTASLRAFLRRHDWPHALLLQEVKINPKDERTKRAVQAAINSTNGSDGGPTYTTHFTLPRDPHNAKGFGGKVYGVASLLRDDFCRDRGVSVRDVEWDLEGRIHVIETRDKLAVFNIYAVNGTENSYRSPETGAVVGTRHDRKLAFHALLLEECRRMEREGWRVVLAGDFNVARSRIDGFPNLREYPRQHCVNRADFNAKFFKDDGGLRAVDVWRKLKGDKKGYTYYPRGVAWGSSCDRVDYAIVSRKLVEEGGLINTGILDSPAERGPSDHVPLWVEVRIPREAGDNQTSNGVNGEHEPAQ
ncbi:hypothetical protein H2201_002667 [Coniosporium apollinis]|uniref:Endonuclease/exonuclease/phosphatase domain-containing protein n=1 Tax=Coniosporium apollinis TaxID=61459 RepID=A0ABQ9P443_9PEZI|nr:hypothetical protein H2201_002667 [Coniosporium apollinis]